jgi:hypothetical protein
MSSAGSGSATAPASTITAGTRAGTGTGAGLAGRVLVRKPLIAATAPSTDTRVITASAGR